MKLKQLLAVFVAVSLLVGCGLPFQQEAAPEQEIIPVMSVAPAKVSTEEELLAAVDSYLSGKNYARHSASIDNNLLTVNVWSDYVGKYSVYLRARFFSKWYEGKDFDQEESTSWLRTRELRHKDAEGIQAIVDASELSGIATFFRVYGEPGPYSDPILEFSSGELSYNRFAPFEEGDDYEEYAENRAPVLLSLRPSGTYNPFDTTVSPVTATRQNTQTTQATRTYVLNTHTKKFHFPSCTSVSHISGQNRWDYSGTRSEVISMGYEPCGNCNP